MLGFICLEGCQALRHPCGRYEHLEQLNEGGGVTLAFLKANLAEKERGWHVYNDCRTVEYTFS